MARLSGRPLGGIDGSSPLIIWINKLRPGFPGTSNGPVSPPLRIDAAVANDSFPSGFSPLWQP